MKQRIHLWYDQEGDFFELGIGKPSVAYAEEIKPGIFFCFDEKTHDMKSVSIFSITRQLLPIDLSLLDLHISYDCTQDVLELLFGQETATTFEDIGDGIFQRVEKKTGYITGLRILSLTTRKKKFINRELFFPFEIPRVVATSTA